MQKDLNAILRHEKK